MTVYCAQGSTPSVNRSCFRHHEFTTEPNNIIIPHVVSKWWHRRRDITRTDQRQQKRWERWISNSRGMITHTVYMHGDIACVSRHQLAATWRETSLFMGRTAGEWRVNNTNKARELSYNYWYMRQAMRYAAVGAPVRFLNIMQYIYAPGSRYSRVWTAPPLRLILCCRQNTVSVYRITCAHQQWPPVLFHAGNLSAYIYHHIPALNFSSISRGKNGVSAVSSCCSHQQWNPCNGPFSRRGFPNIQPLSTFHQNWSAQTPHEIALNMCASNRTLV